MTASPSYLHSNILLCIHFDLLFIYFLFGLRWNSGKVPPTTIQQKIIKFIFWFLRAFPFPVVSCVKCLKILFGFEKRWHRKKGIFFWFFLRLTSAKMECEYSQVILSSCEHWQKSRYKHIVMIWTQTERNEMEKKEKQNQECRETYRNPSIMHFTFEWTLNTEMCWKTTKESQRNANETSIWNSYFWAVSWALNSLHKCAIQIVAFRE